MDALHEPAILYIIFKELSQRDLLLSQRVCRSWRSTITSDNRLLSLLWLRPGRLDQDNVAVSASPPAPPHINPLLKQHFQHFFTPITYIALGHMQLSAVYMHPEASWRRMIPCRPTPIELQLNIHSDRQGYGTFKCLTFTNDDSSLPDSATDASRMMHPPWLTFGLIYDIVGASWFRGVPLNVGWAYFDYSYLPAASTWEEDFGRYKNIPIYSWDLSRAMMQSQFPHKQISGPGRALVSLREDWRLAKEIAADRKKIEALKREVENKPLKEFHTRLLEPIKLMISTKQNGLTAVDIDWDEIYEYGSGPPSPSDAIWWRVRLSKCLGWRN